MIWSTRGLDFYKLGEGLIIPGRTVYPYAYVFICNKIADSMTVWIRLKVFLLATNLIFSLKLQNANQFYLFSELGYGRSSGFKMDYYTYEPPSLHIRLYCTLLYPTDSRVYHTDFHTSPEHP